MAQNSATPVRWSIRSNHGAGSMKRYLAESVRRKPTPLSVWMVNRILNAEPADAAASMALLRSVAENPAASESTKRRAAHFVEYQARAN